MKRSTKSTRSPIYQDIVPGVGGIAGGRFDRATDSVNPYVTQHYVAAEYIVGQWYYIEGD